MYLASSRGTLQQRAQMLSLVRLFFSRRGILEVDTPVLSSYAPIDSHIDVMQVNMGKNEKGYLHTSPEYAMKKLLAKGSGDIYQLSHVFRANENGPLHSPEFSMIEWYRVKLPLEKLITETLDLIRLFLGDLPHEILTYSETFLRYVGIDPYQDDLEPYVINISPEGLSWDRDVQLQLLFSHFIEPKMNVDKLLIIKNFPASQAALAKTEVVDNIPIAKRFEIYLGGVELANGFDELRDPVEQKKRFCIENKKRVAMGKDRLPEDPDFIDCLSSLPECVGVAVGFDRLMKLFSTPISAQSENVSQH